MDIRDYNATLTPDERSESARKAGKASGEARRAYRRQRDLAKQVMATRVTDEQIREKLNAIGIDDTFGAAVILAQAAKAIAGDTEAARYLRDTLGEKPTEQYNLSVTDKPIKALDLSGMTDEELEALADQAEN